MTDYGMLLTNGGVLIAQSNDAYSFGTGDFSLETLVQSTTPGTLISRLGSDGGTGNGGFLLVIEAGGIIKFATYDGGSYFQATTASTIVLDGDWHHIAAVRQNGTLMIYLDAKVMQTTTTGSAMFPTNVDNNLRLVLGGTDYDQEPANRLTGTLDDAAIWSRALTRDDIVDGMFERISPSAPGLMGYWTLNNTMADSSPIGNSLSADGDVEFVAVYHWASLDFCANLPGQGVICAPSNAVYNVGTGDFTVGGYVQTTQPGPVISRGNGSEFFEEGGFLLVIEPDNVVKFSTYNSEGYFQVETAGTSVLDGSWHHVVATRSQGTLSIFLDGQPVPTTSSGEASPLDVNNSLRLLIGGTDQSQEPSNQFVGALDDVCFWNIALTQNDLDPWRFNQLTGAEPGLVSFYSLNGNAQDLSPTHNNATCDPNVTFGVNYCALQTFGSNSYTYCAITSDPPPPVLVARGVARNAVAEGTTIRNQQSIIVQPGSPVFIAALNTPGDQVELPVGVTLSITDPGGQIYNGMSSSDSVHVALDDAGSIAQLVVINPVPGTWVIVVNGPPDARFQCQVSALPSQDVANTITAALEPVYPQGQSLALSIGPRGLRFGSSWSCWWCLIGAWSLAIIVAAAILAIISVATGGGFLAACAAVAAFIGVSGGAIAGAFIMSCGTMALSQIVIWLCILISECERDSGQPTLETVVANIRNKVGVPAAQGAMASRADAGIDASYPITIDVGGEGPKPWDGSSNFHGLVVGFANAININDKTETTGGPPTRDIPLLVKIADWNTNPGYPFAGGFANYITLQNSPLTDTNVTEMARTIAPGGKIGLWIDPDDWRSQINQLAAALNTTPQYNAPDEFKGAAGFPKTLLVNKR